MLRAPMSLEKMSYDVATGGITLCRFCLALRAQRNLGSLRSTPFSILARLASPKSLVAKGGITLCGFCLALRAQRNLVASDQPPFRFWLGWPRRNRWWPRAESPFADFASRFALSEIWWPRAESNHRHTDFQSAALPTELLGHYLKRGITILIQKQVKPTAYT